MLWADAQSSASCIASFSLADLLSLINRRSAGDKEDRNWSKMINSLKSA